MSVAIIAYIIHPCTMLGVTTDSFGEVDACISTAAHCLKLPGKILDLTALLYKKKFRAHGYKSGAQAAFERLEKDGLGTQDPPVDDPNSLKKVL